LTVTAASKSLVCHLRLQIRIHMLQSYKLMDETYITQIGCVRPLKCIMWVLFTLTAHQNIGKV